MWALLRRFAPAIATGLLLGMAFPTYHLFPLAWLGLMPLLLGTRGHGVRRSAGDFYVAGAVFHLFVLQWLMSNVYWVGGWAFIGYVVLSLFLAGYWAGLGALTAYVSGRVPWLPLWIFLPAAWVTMEWLEGVLFTGFGWTSLGYSQGSDLALLQWASLGGGLIISFLLVTVNTLLSEAIVARGGRRWGKVAVAIAIAAGAHAVGMMLIEEADYDSNPLKVGVLQANFPLEMKWDPEYAVPMVESAAEKSGWLADRFDLDLVIWPESLVMREIDSPGIFEAVQSLGREHNVALFTGSHRTNEAMNDKPMNSSYLFDETGEIEDYYDKVHLAPFGEYVPFEEIVPFMESVVPSIGGIGAGSDVKTFRVRGRTFGPLICFEVIFPSMSQQLRAEGADFLAVITNLSWFGGSSAILQELEIARVRAVETRLPLVHAANSGISGVFDPWGRFQRVDTYVLDQEDYVPVRPVMTAAEIRGLRMMGAFDLAAPAEQPLPFGSRYFPWCAGLLTALLVVAAMVMSRRRPSMTATTT